MPYSTVRPTVQTAAVRVAVLVFESCMVSSVTGLLETLSIANALNALQRQQLPAHEKAPYFEGHLVSFAKQPLSLGHGLQLVAEKVPHPTLDKFDAVVIPGIWHTTGRELKQEVLGRQAELEWLQACAQQKIPIFASCSGVALLAEAGLLNGRRATSAWWLGEFFRRRYPAVQLQLDTLLVTDQGVTTGGAATAFFSMAIELIRQFSHAETADLVARFMLIEPNRGGQSPYMISGLYPLAVDPVVSRAQQWIQKNFALPITLEEIAAHTAVSARTLMRRFQQALQDTPLSYIQRIRIDCAKNLLSTTNLALTQVMNKAGYADMSAFRKLFRQHTGLTPREYRLRFRVTGH